MSSVNIVNISVSDLKAYPQNAKAHPPEQITKIAMSINEYGFNVPLLIDESKTIIAGHGRLLAAKELALKEVPCIKIEHLTDDQVRAFRIADNKVTESGWLDDELQAEIKCDAQTQMGIGC